MRKRILALALLNTILLALGVPQPQVIADDVVLNRQKAMSMILDHSTALWEASENVKFSEKSYRIESAKARGVDTNRMFLYQHPYTEEDIYYYFEPYEQMQMRLMKEFIPEQYKLSWEADKMSIKLTENVLANTANELFLALYSTYHQRALAQKSLELAVETYEHDRVRFKNGLMTTLDFEESHITLTEAENAVDQAERAFENMHRQFNSLAGLPLDFRYEAIGAPWYIGQPSPVSEEEAVQKALDKRMEVWSLKQQMQLIELKMEINRHKNVHLSHPKRREDYQKSQDDLDKLNLQIEEQEYSIKKEIKGAIQDLQAGLLDLELARLNLARQKIRLDSVCQQAQAGLVPASVVDQMEYAAEQLEFAVNINIIKVLNQHDRLERATNEGPGY